jgi:hypothetical protein
METQEAWPQFTWLVFCISQSRTLGSANQQLTLADVNVISTYFMVVRSDLEMVRFEVPF